jgi:hypothetical protein
MSAEHESGGRYRPVPVSGLPLRENGQPWYRTLDDAIDAWAHENDLHGETKLPEIYVYLHSHIGGWSVQ